MKKATTIFIVLFGLITLNLSCSKDDDTLSKEQITSIYYDADNKVFVLKYNTGKIDKKEANVDYTTTPPTASVTLANGTVIRVEDAEKSGDVDSAPLPDEDKNEYVNNWIYDEMSIYYLWNDKITKSPDFSLKPDKFFDSILNKYNKTSNPDGDRFSWIQEDYAELQQSLSGGASGEIGFEYIMVGANSEYTHYYPLVLYTKKGTDAEREGIKRGQFVLAVNGQKITRDNINTMFGGIGSKKLTMAEWVLNEEGKEYELTPIEKDASITISNQAYWENPVYKDTTYTINNTEIGYLVYNFFATDPNDGSNSYDKLLMNKLSEMNSKGVKELVLDLRYNSGGAVSSAIALASALVKDRSTDNILTTSEYNSIVHNALKKEYDSDYNKDYFIDKITRNGKKVIDIPEMGLNRLYVLTGMYTASASEFVINGLKPYMNEIVLIGETTYGKNVGSISIYEEDDPKNKWGMQPIIVKYKNSLGFSDFTSGFEPDYAIDEFEDLFLYPLGDLEEPLLNRAVSLITGDGAMRTKSKVRSAETYEMKPNKKAITKKAVKFELVDDKNQENIRKVIAN